MPSWTPRISGISAIAVLTSAGNTRTLPTIDHKAILIDFPLVRDILIKFRVCRRRQSTLHRRWCQTLGVGRAPNSAPPAENLVRSTYFSSVHALDVPSIDSQIGAV